MNAKKLQSTITLFLEADPDSELLDPTLGCLYSDGVDSLPAYSS